MGRVAIHSDMDYRPSNDEIAIEIGSRRDNAIVYGPTKDRLRARWVFSHHQHQGAHDSYQSLQGSDINEIPGHALVLNVRERYFKIIDLLRDTREGRLVWEKMDRVLDRFREFFPESQPGKIIEHVNLTDDQLKDHLYYMWYLWSEKKALLMDGSEDFPSKEQILAMPGGRVADHFTNVYKKPEERLVDVVKRDSEEGGPRFNPRGGREKDTVGAAA